MNHYGDITKINGFDVPLVDIVTGGSPCQDLSVAGKRAGLDGERSGLFMEQIRIIKEMREHDRANRGTDVDFRLLRPRYMVWENVPGAFSSNKGEDFRCVLEETAKIVCEDAVIPRPEEGQKWTPSGCILGEGWSIAWRVHDAQFWGVPQRRKRIALVADFGGLSAPEILFERESLSGDSEPSEQERKETSGDVGTSVDSSSFTLKIRGGVEVDSKGKKAGKGALIQTELSGTLGVSQDQTLTTKCLNAWDNQSKRVFSPDGVAPTINSGTTEGMNIVPSVMVDQPKPKKCLLTSRMGTGGGNVPMIIGKEPVCVGNGQLDQAKISDKVGALNCMHDQQAVITRNQSNMVVRRLTPLECERLQGFPDGWTDIGEWIDSKGKKRKDADSPRYKALGNSIALPFWRWLAERIVAQYEGETTMASLFDGIGGFPLVFSRCGCIPKWASEIEEFPMAVTKIRFSENETERVSTIYKENENG